ncbi:protein kinase domain-containing protein [Vibrio fluvialis]|uniref:protein kinase domain-containing protein n=1 Tax=Vibrio fluvialis TaxID=676 RepID=UPI0006464C8E|nr:protein kinase [Vibrio fluvialis]
MASDRYEYLKDIDNGAYGSVRLYFDKYLDRNVAVKKIDFTTTDKLRILEEVKLLKSVSSKHVVSIYDVLHSNDNIEIYQEYLSGDDLISKAGNCDLQEFLSLSYQLAFGLSDIHSSGVCHRDIKLENAKFDEQGVLKIFDFGVSREGDPHLTLCGHGTMEYRAPEIYGLLVTPSVELTFSVDIFAFGVMLHKLAFNEQCNFSGYVPKVKHSSPRFSELGLSNTLTQLLERTLEKQPNNRPAARELVEQLGRELTRNKHIGRFVSSDSIYVVDHKTPTAILRLSTGQSISVQYDGYDFRVQNVNGNVLINNNKAKINDILHQACVLTFDTGKPERYFVSFSSSHPEIVL